MQYYVYQGRYLTTYRHNWA